MSMVIYIYEVFKTISRDVDLIYLYCFYIGSAFESYDQMLEFGYRLLDEGYAIALIDIKDRKIKPEKRYMDDVDVLMEVDNDLFFDEYLDAGRILRLKLRPFYIDDIRDLKIKPVDSVNVYMLLHISGVVVLTVWVRIRDTDLDFIDLRGLINISDSYMLARLFNNIIKVNLVIMNENKLLNFLGQGNYSHVPNKEGNPSYLSFGEILTFYEDVIHYKFFEERGVKIKKLDELNQKIKYLYNLEYPILIIRSTNGLKLNDFLENYAEYIYSLVIEETDPELVKKFVPGLKDLVFENNFSYEEDKALFVGCGNALIIISDEFKEYIKEKYWVFENELLRYEQEDIVHFEFLILLDQLLEVAYGFISSLPRNISPIQLADIRRELVMYLEEYHSVRMYSYGESREFMEQSKEILGLNYIYDILYEKLDLLDSSINSSFQEISTRLQVILTIIFGAFAVAQTIATLYPENILMVATSALIVIIIGILYLRRMKRWSKSHNFITMKSI